MIYVFELLVLCAVNPLLTGGFPYRRSIVWNCVVWLMYFALLVERWCMIKGFHTPGPVCGVSICSNPPHKRTEAFMSSFMFVQRSCWTNNGDANESKTHETQIMLLLCNLSFSNWWHYCPCVRWITGHQWIPVARGHWSWTLVVLCAAIPPPVVPLTKARLGVFLMFALTSYLTNNRVASELKSLDAYAMPLLCVICQSDIPHGWTTG